MRMSRIALCIAAAMACVGVGVLIGRAQSSGKPMLHGEGVEDRLVAILRMEEPLPRALELATFFLQVHPSEFEVIDEVYKRRYSPADDAIARTLYAAWWARFDPAGALEGRKHDPLGLSDPWLRTVMREAVRQDPSAMRATFESISGISGEARFGASMGVIDAWFDDAENDPDDLLVLFDGLQELRKFNDLVRLWARRMIEKRGVEYSLAYVESMPEDKASMRVKRELMGRLSALLVTFDFERAMVFAEKNMASDAGTRVAYYTVGAWSRFDGPAAITWAMPFRLPNSHKVVERGWKNFLLHDPDAAMAWMKAQPVSRDLEPAYALYVARVAGEDPQRALALSEKIEDKRRLTHARQAIGRAWIAEDPEGAEAWMAETDLPEEIKRRIRAVKPK